MIKREGSATYIGNDPRFAKVTPKDRNCIYQEEGGVFKVQFNDTSGFWGFNWHVVPKEHLQFEPGTDWDEVFNVEYKEEKK